MGVEFATIGFGGVNRNRGHNMRNKQTASITFISELRHFGRNVSRTSLRHSVQVPDKQCGGQAVDATLACSLLPRVSKPSVFSSVNSGAARPGRDALASAQTGRYLVGSTDALADSCSRSLHAARDFLGIAEVNLHIGGDGKLPLMRGICRRATAQHSRARSWRNRSWNSR